MKLGRIKQPPHGWHFPVAEGVMLRAMNEDILTSQINEYRMRNNIPPGDIERDIDEYYCSKWPESCQKEAADYAPGLGLPRDPPKESLVKRVSRWVTNLISRMPRGGFSMVSTQTAANRAMVCAGCPGNKPWRTGCLGCSSNVATLLLQIRSLRKTPHDSLLFACNFGGWGNEAAVHMEADQLPLTDMQKKDLPERCWRKGL